MARPKKYDIDTNQLTALAKLGFNDTEIESMLMEQGEFEPSDIDDQGDIDEPAEKCEACGQTLPK